jgi:hypothetical protein
MRASVAPFLLPQKSRPAKGGVIGEDWLGPGMAEKPWQVNGSCAWKS